MIFATGDGYTPVESTYKWWLSGLVILVLSLGCAIPTSRKRVIPEGIAVTPETLVEKLDSLTPGMGIRETFKFLQIEPKTPGVREIVTAEEKQKILYGAAQLVGSPDEMERFRHRLAKHRILEIKLIDLENDLTFDSPVSILTTQTGPNFVCYLIFYEGQLIEGPSRPENFYFKETNRVYMSELFGILFKSGMGKGMDQVGN